MEEKSNATSGAADAEDKGPKSEVEESFESTEAEVEGETDPLAVLSQDTELIKEAQSDVSKFDVLVCGECHDVFHFVEELQAHKASECSHTLTVKYENEGKSQAWGFALWKAKQRQTLKEKSENLLTSWEFYQRWTKLSQTEKNLWIGAGSALKFCSQKAAGRVPEVKKEERDPLALDEEESASKTGVRSKRQSKDQDEFTVDQIVGKRFNPKRRQWEYEVKWENYEDRTWEPLAHLGNCKSLVDKYEKAQAEKIKAATPRGRGRPRVNASQQTPGAASPAPKSTPTVVKATPKKVTTPTTSTPIILNTSVGRPQRSCKQKALTQVKAWCNSEEDGGGLKRQLDDANDSDDSFGNTLDENDVAKMPLRKVAKIIHTYNNGSGRTKLPDNVLIPDAKGVVRISQKQLPSLASGVYIMSKSSGIIKLDPAASKIATSGRQAIVKVSPRIGQTQIKVIKKEDGTKRIVQVKTSAKATASPGLVPIRPKLLAQQVQVQMGTPKKPQVALVVTPQSQKNAMKVETSKPTIVTASPLVINPNPVITVKSDSLKTETTPSRPKKLQKTRSTTENHDESSKSRPNDDDSDDDGIPELEFPTDLPLPAPDSPPGDFVLDPFTGKVAGVEYPEREPEPETTPTETIDNIVQLAAADITEDDLKADLDPLAITPTPTPPSSVETVNNTIFANTNIILTTSNSQNKTTKASILNTALTNSNILQKSPQKAHITSKVIKKQPPKAYTSTILSKPRPSPSGAIIRAHSMHGGHTKSNLVRSFKSAETAKPKFNIAPMSPYVKSTYQKTNNVARRIGNTTVYKTVKSPAVQKPIKKPMSNSPRAIISMPSLDEEQPVKAAPKQTTTIAMNESKEAEPMTTSLASLGLVGGANDQPMFITADDGTVYQVAGQNEEGQTILLAQDGDGQQCLVLTSDAMEEVVQQQEEVVVPAAVEAEQPLVAEFVRTEPPSPGGTHKVVVMLPDGDVMVTEVTPEEYASLELDK